MSCIQVHASQLAFNFTDRNHSLCSLSMVCITPPSFQGLHKTSQKLTKPSSAYQCTRHGKTSLKLSTGASRYLRCAPVCLFGGKGKSEGGNEASPWSALEKAMGNLKKEQSIEDLLRQQIEKKEFFNDGGSGGSNSGGGGGGDNSGGSEDESESGDGILDEVLQVIFATMGFLFLYRYIIDGEDMARIAKDVFKFIFSGKKSIRLEKIMYQWGSFYQRLNRKEEVDPYWLENEIVHTPTFYDSPEKYKAIMAYLASRSRESDE